MVTLWLVLLVLQGIVAKVPTGDEILKRLDTLESLVHTNGELLRSLQSMDRDVNNRLMYLDKELESLGDYSPHSNHKADKTESGIEGTLRPKLTEKRASHDFHYRGIPDMTGSTSGVYQRVAFSATFGPQRSQILYDSSPLVFETVLLNIRSEYNSTSGVFVSPVPGVYLFSVSVLVNEGFDCEVELVKNGTGIAKARANAVHNRRDQGSLTAILLLDEGEKVYVRGYQSPGVPVWGDMHTSFTGVLLWALA